MTRRTAASLLFSALAYGQQTNPARPPAGETDDTQEAITLRSGVREILAPTTVLDKEGVPIDNLKADDFILLDNGRPQRVTEELTELPISLVIAIQQSYEAEKLLPRIKRIGPLIENMLTGRDGEAAILSFSSRVNVLQEFTNDGQQFTKALDKLTPGAQTKRLIDAVTLASRMLRNRPGNRRRVILLISDESDRGSEGRLRDALYDTQFAGVSIYAVRMDAGYTAWTRGQLIPRPDPVPPSARPSNMGGSMSPTMAQQSYGRGYTADLGNGFRAIFTQAKQLFFRTDVEALTQWTGGREFKFASERALEEAIQKIQLDLRSQYMLAWNPAPETRAEGGYHTIQVKVRHPRADKVFTRPGYWAASQQ